MSDQLSSGELENQEIHRADPGERRRTLWILVLMAIVATFLFSALQIELGNIQARLEAGDADLATGRFLLLARGSFVLLAMVGLVTGAVIGQGALAVIREQRYPHSKARLVRDWKVSRGPQAVFMGRMGIAVALGFALVGCAGAAYGWQMLDSFR